MSDDEKALFAEFKLARGYDGAPRRSDATVTQYVARLRYLVAVITGAGLPARPLVGRAVWLIAERVADVIAHVTGRKDVRHRSKEQDLQICAAWCELPSVGMAHAGLAYKSAAQDVRLAAVAEARAAGAFANLLEDSPLADAPAHATAAAAAAAAAPAPAPAPAPKSTGGLSAVDEEVITAGSGPRGVVTLRPSDRGALLAAAGELHDMLRAATGSVDGDLLSSAFSRNMRAAEAILYLGAELCDRALEDADAERDIGIALRAVVVPPDALSVPAPGSAAWRPAPDGDAGLAVRLANGTWLRWRGVGGFNPAARSGYASAALPTLTFTLAVGGNVAPFTVAALERLLYTFLLDAAAPIGAPVKTVGATWGDGIPSATTILTWRKRVGARMTAGLGAAAVPTALAEHCSRGAAWEKTGLGTTPLVLPGRRGGDGSMYKKIEFAPAPALAPAATMPPAASATEVEVASRDATPVVAPDTDVSPPAASQAGGGFPVRSAAVVALPPAAGTKRKAAAPAPVPARRAKSAGTKE